MSTSLYSGIVTTTMQATESADICAPTKGTVVSTGTTTNKVTMTTRGLAFPRVWNFVGSNSDVNGPISVSVKQVTGGVTKTLYSTVPAAPGYYIYQLTVLPYISGAYMRAHLVLRVNKQGSAESFITFDNDGGNDYTNAIEVSIGGILKGSTAVNYMY